MQVCTTGTSMVQLSSVKPTGAISGSAKIASTFADSASKTPLISISRQAKAASDVLSKVGVETSGTSFSQQFFDKINSLQGQDKIDAYAKAAGLVSAQQGLQAGQFDFTHMTKGQAEIAATYLKNKGDPESTGILTALSKSGTGYTSQAFNVSDLVASVSKTDSANKDQYNTAIEFIAKFDKMVKDDGKADPTDTTVYGIVQTDEDGNRNINVKGHIVW